MPRGLAPPNGFRGRTVVPLTAGIAAMLLLVPTPVPAQPLVLGYGNLVSGAEGRLPCPV